MSTLNLTEDATHYKATIVCVLLLILSSGCDPQEDGTQQLDFDFATGEFQVQTHAVDDRCLDGGLNLLFMPEGDDQPWEWPYPVTLHDPGELEATYTMELREPFGEMEVTATESAPAEQHLDIHPNPEVKLGEERFGDCIVELAGHGEVTLIGPDEVEGIIYIELSDPRGDDRCPADMADRCDVNVGFTGERMD